MTDKDATIRALDRVVREARNEPVPGIDWEAMEQRLSAQIAVTRMAEPKRLPWAGVVLAAAAVVALGVGASFLSGHRGDATVAHQSAHRVYTRSVDGAQLAVGDRVVAAESPIAITQPGRAEWTLAPHSSASMADTGRFMTVRLDNGSVRVAVVPGHTVESFAIEVEETRVAAHGTRFTVERRGDRANVVLDEGVVAVGSARDRGQTRGFTMTAPSTGSFSLDGAREGEVRGPETAKAPAETPEVAAPAPAHVATQAGPSGRSENLPEAPSAIDLERQTASVMALVEQCFVDNTEASHGVTISVRSTLTFEVGSGGEVAGLGSDPPLAPAVQECSTHALAAIHFERSRKGAHVTRTLHLAR